MSWLVYYHTSSYLSFYFVHRINFQYWPQCQLRQGALLRLTEVRWVLWSYTILTYKRITPTGVN